MRSVIRVKEIKGHCPVYSLEDIFFLERGYILDSAHSCRICMHSLASIMPYYVALSHGVNPAQLGLNRTSDGIAYVQCLDPCEHTGGGTVILEIHQEG